MPRPKLERSSVLRAACKQEMWWDCHGARHFVSIAVGRFILYFRLLSPRFCFRYDRHVFSFPHAKNKYSDSIQRKHTPAAYCVFIAKAMIHVSWELGGCKLMESNKPVKAGLWSDWTDRILTSFSWWLSAKSTVFWPRTSRFGLQQSWLQPNWSFIIWNPLTSDKYS